MPEAPFMPKATAVWLVENTTITFKQIADFCNLHELEIKGIADGNAEFAKKTEEVIQCFTTTGNGSHVLIIQTENSRSLEALLRQIQAWPGVMRTETQIILSNYK